MIKCNILQPFKLTHHRVYLANSGTGDFCNLYPAHPSYLGPIKMIVSCKGNLYKQYNNMFGDWLLIF